MFGIGVTDESVTAAWSGDERRRLEVYANADNGPDAARARRYGAQGVGL